MKQIKQICEEIENNNLIIAVDKIMDYGQYAFFTQLRFYLMELHEGKTTVFSEYVAISVIFNRIMADREAQAARFPEPEFSFKQFILKLLGAT